jgi:hypothetical protein
MSSSAARHRLARRVVVKARVVHQRGPSGRSPKAHLIYLQRDGAGQEHGQGELYNARETGLDRDAFLERCEDDRHHFRLIVSPEDGDKLQDLQAYTRDLMRQVEQDLGTRLDWVAVDHHNTGHPHSHILIRGVDEDGKTLLIARDYMAHGFRLRAAELVTLELGQQTELEIQTKLQNEVGQKRFTRLDRAAVLPVAFLISAVIRTAQGSATVAMITAVGMLSALNTPGALSFHPVYIAIVIGCGSKLFPWMNDSGFWIVTKMSGFTEAESIRNFSLLLTTMGITGLIATMIFAKLLPLI